MSVRNTVVALIVVIVAASLSWADGKDADYDVLAAGASRVRHGHWQRWDGDELASGFGMPVRMVVGQKDEFALEMNRHVQELMENNADVKVEAVRGDDHMLASLRHGRSLEFIPTQSNVASQP